MLDLFASKGAVNPARVIKREAPVRRDSDDDLLTAGLGLAGLRSEVLPDNASLRQRDLHRHWRELVNVTEEGGFGRLYGPPAGHDLCVPGEDVSALLQLRSSRHPFAVRVLIPDNLDTDTPCLIVAPSSGSRGAMGSIGDLGAWALTRGFALALTDKGTGVGAHLLGDDTVYHPHSLEAARPDEAALFRQKPSAELDSFKDSHPFGVALKHLHAEENIEADWPHYVLAAAQFAKETFADALAQRGRPARFKTIAAGVSNGGGAVLRAGELKGAGVIDAIVAVEPNAVPAVSDPVEIIDCGEVVTNPARDLYDVASTMGLLAPIACLNPEFADAPLNAFTAPLAEFHQDWAARAGQAGMVSGTSDAARARDALRQMRALGFQRESDGCMHAMVALQIWPAVTFGFAHMLSTTPVHQPIGGVTLAFADPGGAPARAPNPNERAQLAARCGGLAPSGGLELIDTDGTSGLSFETMSELRALWSGGGAVGKRLRKGAGAVRASAKPIGLPTMIVHGRGDSLINVNHTSRPYMAAAARHGAPNLRYYEVDHAQHFETLLMLPGFSDFYTPLAPATGEALQRMVAHLWAGDALPPSQRVRAFPAMGEAASARGRLTDAHIGGISDEPGPIDRIEIAPNRIFLADPSEVGV